MQYDHLKIYIKKLVFSFLAVVEWSAAANVVKSLFMKPWTAFCLSIIIKTAVTSKIMQRHHKS